MADVAELPPAITQMTVEEDTWRVHKISERGTRQLMCFGLDDDGEYRRRILAGTDDEARLAELDQLPGEHMSREDAVSLRESVDGQWQIRRSLQTVAECFFEEGFFSHNTGGRLVGAVEIPGFGDNPRTIRTLALYRDGTLMAQIQKDGELFEDRELICRRYWMPRGTSMAYHDRKVRGMAHILRTQVINPSTILSVVKAHVTSIGQNLERLVPKESLDASLVPSSPARPRSDFGLGDLDIAS